MLTEPQQREIVQVDVPGAPTGVSVNGTVGGTADQAWFGWATTSNVVGRVVNEKTSPVGVGFAPTVAIPSSDLSYGYDRAGRLTSVDDVRNGQCTVRRYGFDSHGNRTSQTSRAPGSGGACATSGGTTATRAFDAADRPTTGANGVGSYSYDELGRQTSMPAADAPDAANKTIGVEYYDTDEAWTITQDGTTTMFSLDGAGRRWTQTVSTGGVTSQTLQRHYTDSGDNPTWTDDVRGGTTTTTRYAELASGNLGLTFTTTGGTTKAELAIPGLRGDIATIITIPAGSEAHDGTSVTITDTWTDFDEYGQPKQAVTQNPGGTQGIGYGWLGQHQRATTDTGLMLMGARLYNPATGTFTSLDPVKDGGDTSYGYPNNPIQMRDLDGQVWFIPVLFHACRLFCARVGAWAIRVAAPAVRRWAATAVRHVATRARSAWSRTKSYVNNGNNVIRVGKVPNGNRRVSVGPAREHWLKQPRWRQQLSRGSLHLERRRGFANWHTKAKTYNRQIY